MPIRSDWQLAREGITLSTFNTLLKSTALNPLLTLPLLLLARYSDRGRALSIEHARAYKALKQALALGVLRKVNDLLGDAVMNNYSNDVYDWKKEVVVVTGGSDGIGAIVVKLLAERGVKVAVLDVQELQFEAPPSVTHFHVDLASKSSIESAASQVKSTLGDPTILINNAGVARGKTILDSTESDIRLTFNVNALSHYFLTQQFLPSMISNNHGMVVTVASVAAYLCAPSMVDYAATKAAALAFHEGLTAELATVYNAPKVRTVIMCQNYTRTALFEGFDSNALHPETVAEAIVKAVFRGRSEHILTPEADWLVLPRIRGFPLWMQYGLRKRLVHLMKGWRGRQVVQPTLEKVEKMINSAGAEAQKVQDAAGEQVQRAQDRVGEEAQKAREGAGSLLQSAGQKIEESGVLVQGHE